MLIRSTLFRSVVCRAVLVAFVASLLPSPAIADGSRRHPNPRTSRPK